LSDRDPSTNGSSDPLERPQAACVVCPPPRGNRAWTLADSRCATCGSCYDKIRERLAEVAERYLRLDACPAGSRPPGSRGAPGFHPRPPGAVHVMAMRDPRSSQDARVWVGSDGRVHTESTRPALSVYGALNLLAWSIAEHRGVSGPDDRDDVYALLRFVDRHVGYVTRHAELAVETDQTLRDLVGALRPVTGDARRQVGTCRAEVDPEEGAEQAEPDEEGVFYCGAPLFASVAFREGEEVVCGACGARYPMDEWLALAEESYRAEHQHAS
jgi:hypothetical protein